MVSQEVEDLVKQQWLEAEGVTNVYIQKLEQNFNNDMERIIEAAATTDARVTALVAESERALTLVSSESEQFAAKVAADKNEMDSRAETFRLAGVSLESQLSEGLGKIKAAQAVADAADLIQSESTRATLAKILEHEAEMRDLNKRNIALIEAKFVEIDLARATATGAAAGASADPMQEHDDWHGQTLGRPNTGASFPDQAWGGKRPRERQEKAGALQRQRPRSEPSAGECQPRTIYSLA